MAQVVSSIWSSSPDLGGGAAFFLPKSGEGRCAGWITVCDCQTCPTSVLQRRVQSATHATATRTRTGRTLACVESAVEGSAAAWRCLPGPILMSAGCTLVPRDAALVHGGPSSALRTTLPSPSPTQLESESARFPVECALLLVEPVPQPVKDGVHPCPAVRNSVPQLYVSSNQQLPRLPSDSADT